MPDGGQIGHVLRQILALDVPGRSVDSRCLRPRRVTPFGLVLGGLALDRLGRGSSGPVELGVRRECRAATGEIRLRLILRLILRLLAIVRTLRCGTLTSTTLPRRCCGTTLWTVALLSGHRLGGGRGNRILTSNRILSTSRSRIRLRSTSRLAGSLRRARVVGGCRSPGRSRARLWAGRSLPLRRLTAHLLTTVGLTPVGLTGSLLP